MHLLGVHLPDLWRTKFALTSFYGIGHHQAARICARLQIHDRCKMRDLTPYQATSLAAFLSAPQTSPQVPLYPRASPNFRAPPPVTSPTKLRLEYHADRTAREANKEAKRLKLEKIFQTAVTRKEYKDPLNSLKIETELRREVRENIAHQKMIGSYVGRRHALGLPVRGQNTQTNAKTARKLNKIERYA